MQPFVAHRVRQTVAMRVGIAHHFGWAVSVIAGDDHSVVDRRRIELIEPGLPPAPIHHLGGAHELHGSDSPPDDDALAAIVDTVRASVARATRIALDELVAASPGAITSISLRAWPDDFPRGIAAQRRVPYESRADSVMYREVLAEAARARGWTVHRYANDVERAAADLLGDRTHDVLHGPRAALGPPWTKDHRTALAATIIAAMYFSDVPNAPSTSRRGAGSRQGAM